MGLVYDHNRDSIRVRLSDVTNFDVSLVDVVQSPDVMLVGRLSRLSITPKTTRNQKPRMKTPGTDDEVLFLGEVAKAPKAKVVPRTAANVQDDEVQILDVVVCKDKTDKNKQKSSKPKKDEKVKKSTTSSTSSTTTDSITKIQKNIYSVLQFENSKRPLSRFSQCIPDIKVSIPKDSLNKIEGTRDLVSEWIFSIENKSNLKIVRMHFQAIEAMLNSLIEDYRKSKNTSVLYGLYSTAVINFACCIESYKAASGIRSLARLASLLYCPSEIITCRNLLAHADSGRNRLDLTKLNAIVAFALHWMNKFFFPNLSLAVKGNQATLTYVIKFRQANLDKNLCQTVNIPGRTVICPDEDAFEVTHKSTGKTSTKPQANKRRLKDISNEQRINVLIKPRTITSNEPWMPPIEPPPAPYRGGFIPPSSIQPDINFGSQTQSLFHFTGGSSSQYSPPHKRHRY